MPEFLTTGLGWIKTDFSTSTMSAAVCSLGWGFGCGFQSTENRSIQRVEIQMWKVSIRARFTLRKRKED